MTSLIHQAWVWCYLTLGPHLLPYALVICLGAVAYAAALALFRPYVAKGSHNDSFALDLLAVIAAIPQILALFILASYLQPV
jgi:hypothetical protein